ncbi:hypothetical protein ON010_g7065 [Phytophthora cinnamomi]|nr:hypothetical protein ON010_g7065 [Phytophthora cinnamomi]
MLAMRLASACACAGLLLTWKLDKIEFNPDEAPKFYKRRAINDKSLTRVANRLNADLNFGPERTTSWQKLLHIKPSDVGLEMVALAWKPDGLHLAVGCNEGDVVVFEMESGEVVPERRSNLRHERCITAMHWAQISEVGASSSNSSNKQRNQKGFRAFEDDWRATQSKIRFQRRSSRFLAGHNGRVAGEDTVLVTADERGFVALWWMGRVLLTRIDVSAHFSEEERQALVSVGCQPGRDCSKCFRIERVDLAPDLSLLFVLLGFSSDSDHPAGTQTKLHRLLTIDMAAVQRIHEDVVLVADTVDRVQSIINRVAATGRQMTTEWKNATRVFELKMGLMGPLYEKYACDDTPQVDMLSAAVTGITAPALTQYFAQDIQEMSVHRMQKALFSGCDTLRTIVDDRMKRDLVDLIFLLSELRGRAKWNPQAYADTLGLTDTALDDLVTIAQAALLEVESLTLALHETRQDFSLFFQWILERIRVHTNSRDASGGNAQQERALVDGAKSLLNLRRLCDFLQYAAETAQRFREHQPSHSKFKVETTFGNAISRQLSTRPPETGNGVDKQSEGCISLLKNIQDQWLALLALMATTLAESTIRAENGCFSIGSSDDLVVESHFHFHHAFSSPKLDVPDNDDFSDDGNQEEAVDWRSLTHFGPGQENYENRSTSLLMGFRLQSGVLVLVRASQSAESVHAHSSHLVWGTALVSFSHDESVKSVTCRGFDFYGDKLSGRNEQLALVLDREIGDNVHQGTSCWFWMSNCGNCVTRFHMFDKEWLYLQAYDDVEFSIPTASSDIKAIIQHGPTHIFRLDEIRGRAVTAPAKSKRTATSVIATASRGVLCVILPPSRLSIFDAEDSEDEDGESDDGQ